MPGKSREMGSVAERVGQNGTQREEEARRVTRDKTLKICIRLDLGFEAVAQKRSWHFKDDVT